MLDNDIINFQYRKVLTEKKNNVDYYNACIETGQESVETTFIDLLSVMLIDLENYELPAMPDSEMNRVNSLLGQANKESESVELPIDIIKSYLTLKDSYRITDELNRTIALMFAEYINNCNEKYNQIGIGVLKSIL